MFELPLPLPAKPVKTAGPVDSEAVAVAAMVELDVVLTLWGLCAPQG